MDYENKMIILIFILEDYKLANLKYHWKERL